MVRVCFACGLGLAASHRGRMPGPSPGARWSTAEGAGPRDCQCPAGCGAGREKWGLTDLDAWWVRHHFPRLSSVLCAWSCWVGAGCGWRPFPLCLPVGVSRGSGCVLSNRGTGCGRLCPKPPGEGHRGAFPLRTGTWILHGGPRGLSASRVAKGRREPVPPSPVTPVGLALG